MSGRAVPKCDLLGARLRFRVDVKASASELPWSEVFGPARGMVYATIAASDAELATSLHDEGWDGHPLKPVGVSCPQFVGAPRVHGKYTTGTHGSVWMGSPFPRIASTLLAGLAGRTSLTWGSVQLAIRGVELESSPDFDAGEATFATATPVLIKKDDQFLAPDDDRFLAGLVHNLRHKADMLELPSDVEVDVIDGGPMRRFDVCGAPRRGATLRARVAADPRLLTALYEWGLGLANNQGFGWIR